MTSLEKQQMRERVATAALTGLLSNPKILKGNPTMFDTTYEELVSTSVWIGALFVDEFNSATEMEDDKETVEDNHG